MKASRIPLALLLVISGIALAEGGNATKDKTAKFKVTAKRKSSPAQYVGGSIE
jgi:hypothetical protein